MSGTSVGVYGTDDYYHDFSNQGACKVIAHIHGHRHKDEYTDVNGYNDIGVNSGLTGTSLIGSGAEFCLSAFSIDPAKRMMFETRIGARGADREYSY